MTLQAPSKSDQHAPATAPAINEGEAPLTHQQILKILIGLLAALFTALLSTTIVSNALPTIISDLQGTQTQYTWVITAALLANAASTPIWGKLSDLFDKKLMVQISILVFVAGSVLAGLSPNVPILIGARVIQGIGLGGLTALVQSIIGAIIPPRERGRYSGYMGGVMAVAMSGGPLLGGVIVDSALGWRWCFYVCIPLAVIALFMLHRTLDLKAVARRKVSIDWLGATLLTSGVSLLLVWVSFAGKAAHFAWVSWPSALMLLGGLALLVALVLVERKAAEPIIPLRIITQRTTGLAVLASIAVGIALFGASTFLGQYYQVSRGYTPTHAGLMTLPLIFGMLIASTVTGQVITRFGKWKIFLVIGAAVQMVGLLLLGLIDHTTSLWMVGGFIAIVGIGTGMLMQNLVLAVQNTVDVSDIGAASGSVAFFRTFGGAIGVSVLGSVLATRVSSLSAQGLAQLGIQGGGSEGSLDLSTMPAPVQEVIRSAYGDGTGLIFGIAGIIAVITLVSVFLIREQPLRTTVAMKSTETEAIPV